MTKATHFKCVAVPGCHCVVNTTHMMEDSSKEECVQPKDEPWADTLEASKSTPWESKHPLRHVAAFLPSSQHSFRSRSDWSC
jgi:hypothetical protein